jgi:hypothetical protein
MQDEQAREELEKINNFQLLMMLINEDKEKKDDLKTILLMILPNYQIILTPRSILCKKGEENLIIDEGNFESFQKILRKVFCQNRKKKDDDDEIPEQYNVQSKKAKEIADELGKVFKAEIKEIYKIDNVQIVDEAVEANSPYNINIVKESIIYLVAGLVLGVGAAYLLFIMDKTIKDTDTVEKKLGLTVMGVVPEVESK